MIRTCINCQISFETEINKKVSCSRKCSQAYRQREVYGDKYTFKHRSQTPRNFLRQLSKKKSSRRNLTVEFLLYLYNNQDGKCALSGRDMTYKSGEGRVPTNISIDRIDSSKGYEENNLQLVCIQANKMKAELIQEDLYSWCKDILRTRNDSQRSNC